MAHKKAGGSSRNGHRQQFTAIKIVGIA